MGSPDIAKGKPDIAMGKPDIAMGKPDIAPGAGGKRPFRGSRRPPGSRPDGPASQDRRGLLAPKERRSLLSPSYERIQEPPSLLPPIRSGPPSRNIQSPSPRFFLPRRFRSVRLVAILHARPEKDIISQRLHRPPRLRGRWQREFFRRLNSDPLHGLRPTQLAHQLHLEHR